MTPDNWHPCDAYDLCPAEDLQTRFYSDQDIHFRRKAWIAVACGLVAFWIALAGIVALVL